MKSINIFIKLRLASVIGIVMILTFNACTNEESEMITVTPSYPDAQVSLKAFREQVLSSEFGWEGTLSPQKGKVYRLFLELNTQGEVLLYTDADSVSSTGASHSEYRIALSQRINPSLIFEEGSHLERIPGSKGNRGVDTEFAYRYWRGDSLFLTGNRYGDELVLVKATQENRERYQNKALRRSVRNISTYLRSVRYLYMQPTPDRLIQFNTNASLRSVYVTELNDAVSFFGSDFAYSLNGILLKSRLHKGDFETQELLWDETKKKLYTYYDGKRIDLMESRVPVVPLYYLLGHEYPPTTVFPTPNLEMLPGWSAKFQSLWLSDDNYLHDKYHIMLYYVITDLQMKDNLMNFWVYYISADGNLLRAKFPYTFTVTKDGIFKFTALPVDNTMEGQNARAMAEHLPNILGVISKNRFRIEFYDAFEELGGLIPQFISQDDPGIYFTGYFYSE